MGGMSKGRIRAGIGGWTFEPWRGTFYPDDLRQKDELAYAAAYLTAIEVNGTYYSSFKPETFRKWAEAAPAGFKFAVKASRFCTNRKILAEGGESVQRFVGQGLAELGDKLGPILWQFMPTKKFEAEDFGAFLKLLPDAVDGVALRHALEVRHESFDDPAFLALVGAAQVAVVRADHATYPLIEGPDVGFTYARLMQTREAEPLGYAPSELDSWAEMARTWAAHGDAYIFFISGAKVRAPAAAQALIDRVGTG
ncbi:DUF72 domain-containing protein [soil metagenome]